jgi:hypothetical protein
MKKVTFVVAFMAFVVALTPWKNDLHAQAGSYGLDGNYKGSTIMDDQGVQ